MSLACLPDDALELVLHALFAPRRGRAQKLCLDDTVFVALVSRRMNDAVRRVFAKLVSAFSDVVGISKPSGRLVLMTNRESIFDAKPGAEGRRFKFVLEWQRPKTVVASARCAYTSRLPQIIKDVLYCPAYQKGLRCTGHAPPVRNSNLWNSGWQAYRASFCSKTLSNWAIKQLVERSPINMIIASCDHCFDRVMEFTPTERVTSLLLMSASRYGRVDVLELLFRQHLDRSTDAFYGVARLLFSESDVALEDGHACSSLPYYMEYFVLPAVLGNRVDVLNWVRAATTELFKRQWPQLARTNIARGGACGTEFRLVVQYETHPYAVDYPCADGQPLSRDAQMRALSGRQPFGPEWHRSRDFACAAILATQCGSVDVLEWMYKDVSCDGMFGYAAEREQQERNAAHGDIRVAHAIASREAHMQAVRLALAVCALNGGNFKRGNVRHDKPYRKLGASARWGLRKWRACTNEGNLGDLCNLILKGEDSTPDGLSLRTFPRLAFPPSNAHTANGQVREPSERSLLSLLQLWAGQRSEYAYTHPGSHRARSSAIFHSVFSFGDEDHTRWTIEETRPGGFLAAHPDRPDDLTVMNTDMPFAASLMHSPVASSVFERTARPALVRRHAAFFMLTEMGGNGLYRHFSAKRDPGVHAILDVYVPLTSAAAQVHILNVLRDTSEPAPLQRFRSVDALECSFEYDALMTAYTLQPGPQSPWPLGREPSCGINRSYGLMLAARLQAAWECATDGDACDYEGMLLEADAILQIYASLNKRYTRDVAHPVTKAAGSVLSELDARDAVGNLAAPHLKSVLARLSTEAEPSR